MKTRMDSTKNTVWSRNRRIKKRGMKHALRKYGAHTEARQKMTNSVCKDIGLGLPDRGMGAGCAAVGGVGEIIQAREE